MSRLPGVAGPRDLPVGAEAADRYNAGMAIDLSPEEHELLLDLLRTDLANLKAEIYRTEAAGFKEQLKAREAILVRLIGRLETGT